MAEKVALPSLSLPKQRTHWTVGVVIAAGVLLVILGAAFYLVLNNRQAEADAFAKHESDRLAAIKAEKEKVEAEKAKAEAEKAASEAKQKEVEASVLAAQKKAAIATADDSKIDKGKKKSSGGHKAGGAKVAASSSKPGSPATPTAAVAPAAPPAPTKAQQTKASKDIDDLLRSFR